MSKKFFYIALISYLILSISFSFLISVPVYAEGKEVTFGVLSDFPPYNWIDENGNSKGLYTDLFNYIKKLLEQNGYKVNLVTDKWAYLVEKLDNDEIQAIIGMSITVERKRKYLFTIPIAQLIYRLYTIKHPYIQSIEELKNPPIPLVVGVLRNSSAEAYLKENFNSLIIKPYCSIGDALKALINNDIDLLMGYQYVIDFYINSSYPKYKNTIKRVNISFPNGKKFHAIAINKNHEQLLYDTDQALQVLYDRGILPDLRQKWFNIDKDTNKLEINLIYYFIFPILGMFIVGLAYHLQLKSTTRELKILLREKENYLKQIEYQMNELTAAREELTAMSEQLMSQQEELTYLYENERTLKQQLEKQNEFLTSLLSLFKVPEKGLDFNTLLKNFLTKTKQTFNAKGVYLYHYVHDIDKLVLISYTGSPDPPLELHPGIIQAFLLDKSTFLPASADPVSSWFNIDDGFILTVPLTSLNEKKGILMLYFTSDIPDQEKHNMISILENLAPSLSIYLENMFIIEEHFSKTVKLSQLIDYIESILRYTDIDSLMKKTVQFVPTLIDMEDAILLDKNNHPLAFTNKKTLDYIEEILKYSHIQEDIVYIPELNLYTVIIEFDINLKPFKLIAISKTLVKSWQISKADNIYLLKLMVRFSTVYANNIAKTKKLQNLLKIRSKERTLLRELVEYIVKDNLDKKNIILDITQIIHKSGFLVKLTENGQLIYGKQDINIENSKTIDISYQGKHYQIVIDGNVRDYIISIIQMIIDMHIKQLAWQKQLEESRVQWLGIIDSLPFPLVATDEQGTIIKLNKTFANMFNASIEELIGKPIQEIVPEAWEACQSDTSQNWLCKDWYVRGKRIGKIIMGR